MRGAGAAAPHHDDDQGRRAGRHDASRSSRRSSSRATSSSTAATRGSRTRSGAKRRWREKGLHFVGMGVSGGEEGARHGPSLMPGGAERGVASDPRRSSRRSPRKTDSGPCVTYVGPDGAGHFVKMVHNGIEYGDMQLIAEAYDVLQRGLGLRRRRARRHLRRVEPRAARVVPDRDHRARSCQVTDPETRQAARRRGRSTRPGRRAPASGRRRSRSISACRSRRSPPRIDARVLSCMKDRARRRRAKICAGRRAARRWPPTDDRQLIDDVHDALYAAKICSLRAGHGAHRRRRAASTTGTSTSREMARIWKGGCIIRARFLDAIMRAYERKPTCRTCCSTASSPRPVQRGRSRGWRRDRRRCAPRPASRCRRCRASLAYFDAYRTADLPQNLTQAQRDAFGAHTYERADHPERGAIHTDWLGAP